MITGDKIKELKKLISSGVPAGEIKEEMIRQGYPDEDIGKVFTPHQYDMRSWYLTFAILVGCLGLFLFLQEDKIVNVIILCLSALLFFAYYREIERLKKKNR
jgi:hypothetical protein